MNDCLNDMYDIVPPLPGAIEANSDKNQILENKIKLLESKLEKIEKTVNEHNQNLKDMENKIKDLNILELFKSSGGENGEDANMMLSLINNIDKKFTAKINFADEKIAKIDEINYKTNKDVQNLLNSSDLNKRNYNQMKQNQEALTNKIENLEKIIKLTYNELSDTFNQKIDSVEKNLSERHEPEHKERPNVKHSTNSINIFSSKKEEKKEEPKLDLENHEKILEITGHLSEIDKFLKNISQHIGLEQIKLDINSLKANIGNCSTLDDMKEVRDKEEELQRQITYLKEQLDDFNADQTDHEDIQNLKRKLESFAGEIHELDENFKDLMNKKNLGNDNKKQLLDGSKYLEIKVYEEFKSQIIKEFNNVNDNFNHIRKLIDNILDSLQNKSSFNDLKVLEEDLLAKIEDLRLTGIKKFADRMETNKNIKYLDQQIKQIIQIYIKKNDKDNNWLIAKKPLNGNLCASCESYIGELRDNTNYIPWNKYPNREVEKLYRLGNGFSKMLQMIQVDENDKKNAATTMNSQNNETIGGNKDDNFIKTSDNIGTNANFRKELPKIKSNMNQTKSYFHTVSNINNFNPDEDSAINNRRNSVAKKEEEQNNQPKITKIYRMNKEN